MKKVRFSTLWTVVLLSLVIFFLLTYDFSLLSIHHLKVLLTKDRETVNSPVTSVTTPRNPKQGELLKAHVKASTRKAHTETSTRTTDNSDEREDATSFTSESVLDMIGSENLKEAQDTKHLMKGITPSGFIDIGKVGKQLPKQRFDALKNFEESARKLEKLEKKGRYVSNNTVSEPCHVGVFNYNNTKNSAPCESRL